MRRRRRARARLAGALAATTVLAAGCGGGSSSPFAGSFHAPAGYSAYHGGGYVVAIPAHFAAKAGSVPDQPPGSTVTEVTKGGSSAARAQSEILLLENPHLKFTLDQVVSNLEQADRTNTSVSDVKVAAAKAQSEILLLDNPHLKFTLDQVVSNLEQADRTNTSVSNVTVSATHATVPGARSARIVTESYVAPDSPTDQAPTHFDRKWLMVLVRPGVLLDVVVANAPSLGGHIDADAVIDSFRLKQG